MQDPAQGMVLSYKTVYKGGTAEIVEKKSRFIAHIAPAGSEEEAVRFIEEKRKAFWDARHNCHAFTVGLAPQMSRCSDDGEPAQTAGKPILDVLLGAGLKNTVVVVTRYFGGTLLGTGGLVRAYSSAVRAGLEASVVIEKQLCSRMKIRMDYSMLGKIQYLAADLQLPVVSAAYTDLAEMEVLVPMPAKDRFLKKITEASGGKIIPEEEEICYGAQADGQTIVFPL